METITNDIDTIDSRDIIERIEELETALDFCPHCGEGLAVEEAEETNTCPDCEQELLEGDELEELQGLRKVVDQAEGCGDFEFGETLINQNYFTEYCQEMCEDCGDIPAVLPWYIADHIDWEGVAREIEMDYMEIDFDGVTYLMRSY